MDIAEKSTQCQKIKSSGILKGIYHDEVKFIPGMLRVVQHTKIKQSNAAY